MKQKLLILLSLIFNTHVASAQSVNFFSFADLVEKLTPSVVNISTSSKAQSDDKQSTLGSGFILDKEGYILTNSHVVDNAKDITAILHDNTPLSAVIIGTDKQTDIALIKVDTTHPLFPVQLGNSETIRVGDWILAIGNPFGLGGSVTAGIISAKSRDIASGPYDSYIQTDASINQGNSGGPMFNLQGEVIGINTALFSTTGANMGIGFAIPINQAHFIIKQLKEHGKVNRSWIGLKIQTQT
ncbi:MAG: trypsin-like peptidase domain-containing protein, partial [Alphaproteobacteria bacterium]|nr:trypsin-like peptidase domain-containing protein [Alphaproteobacteria bacterium]